VKLKISALEPESKITGVRHRELDTDETVLAIVKVSEPDYVPRCTRLRSRIDRHMITVECRYGAISMLEVDPRVESVALQKPLRMID